MWFGFEYVHSSFIKRSKEYNLLSHTKKIEERKQNPNNSPSILLKRPIYVCTFSLFELEKNVMQLLSKAQKKEKHNNFFFKDTPESFVATSNSLKPFYKKKL